MSERETARGELGLVQAFVNSVDLQPEVEELKDPNTLRDWLVARGLMDGAEPVDESDLKNAIAVREAMRGVIGGNSGLRIYPGVLATLNQAAAASRLRMRFAPHGRPRPGPGAAGAGGAVGRPPSPGPGGRGRGGCRVWGPKPPAVGPSMPVQRPPPAAGATWPPAATARRPAASGSSTRLSELGPPLRRLRRHLPTGWGG